ncbi:MAG: sigma-54-dependent transcriptional regulator [Pirellulales bacterium]
MKTPDSWKILLVDDDEASRLTMAEWLGRRGYDAVPLGSGQEAIEHIHDGVAVIVTDLKMPGTSGLDLLRAAKEQAPHAAVILVSGHGTVDTAVTALKEGAFDFLTKPVNLQELTHRIQKAVERRVMSAEIARLHAELNQRHGLQNMIGTSSAMRSVFEKVRLVAETRSTVLITGESGTGKELVARSIHHLGQRRSQPFIPVNCAAIPETLIESELFGYEKGAFTGATEQRRGLFESAQGGTLLIDEIGQMPSGLQSKLLRAIESRKILRVGSSQEIDVDVRLLAATNRDLTELVKEKQFRQDLYYRLKVVEIELPPLRERREDIPLLVRSFIDEIVKENERPIQEITSAALDALIDFDWPGNVRELHNTLEGLIVLSMDDRIDLGDLPSNITGAAGKEAIFQPGLKLRDLEREAIRRALRTTKGHRGKAAEMLGISVRTLQRKISEYEIQV